MGDFKEYDQYDGLGLAELVKKKEVSAADLLGDFAGVPQTMGSRACKNYVPDRDSELVKRYKQAGLVILGKTNTPEFGLLPYTEPELHGPTRNPWNPDHTPNPWNPDHTPGGSSGGSAAAVASGMVPLASANDGAGSIRIPASCCGLFGLKVTRGRTPNGPIHGRTWQGAVVEHVISRSVRDSAAILDATQGTDLGAPYVIAPAQRKSNSAPIVLELLSTPGRQSIPAFIRNASRRWNKRLYCWKNWGTRWKKRARISTARPWPRALLSCTLVKSPP
jgi:amidase